MIPHASQLVECQEEALSCAAPVSTGALARQNVPISVGPAQRMDTG